MGIITFIHTAVSVAVADLSTFLAYLKLIIVPTLLIPRFILVNGLAFNPMGNSFLFSFTIPYHSLVHFVKKRFYDLHSEWSGFRRVRDMGDIEIWRVPRIKGGKIPGLDERLQEIFRMNVVHAARHVEAFTEIVLEGVRMEDGETVEEGQGAAIDVMVVVPGSEKTFPFPSLFYHFI